LSNDSWEYWILDIKNLDNLTRDEKEKAKNALLYIKDLFNEDLNKLIKRKHPITYYIVNSVPWTRRWLVSLVEAIAVVSNQKNGSKVLNKITSDSKDEFMEAILQLSVGRCLIDSGFGIEFLKEDDKSKIVDWKIVDLSTNEEMLVELTAISKPPENQKQSDWAFDQISKRLFTINIVSNSPYLLHRGQLLKEYISKPALAELIQKINFTAEQARKRGFTDLIEENTIYLAFATQENKNLLRSWAIEHKVINSEEFDNLESSLFKGPKFQINEVYRIFTRIEDKKGQLNKKDLNVLIIRDDRVFYSRESIPAYIDHLKQFVYDHDYLSMLILVGASLRQQIVDNLNIEYALENQSSVYLELAMHQMVRNILIISNIYSKDNAKTHHFYSMFKTGFKTCKTILT
jgi:hypothetical protein